MGAPPDISIVIPTYNRAGLLAALIAALRDQHADGIGFEIIVVDNGSTDWTRAAVDRAARSDGRVRYILERRQGASHARNAGIAEARGAIVAFLDDDVLPARDWLASLQLTFDAHPEVDCVGGRVEPLWPHDPPRWLTARHYAPLALQMNRAPEFDANHASACLVTANFACRRQVFAEVGGFAPEFLRDEDREFNLRLWRAGKRGLYTNQVRAVAAVDPARLRKSYHRRWYEVTGANHARLRYREIIDRDGRLVAPMAARTLFGTPTFVYREGFMELARWAWNALRFRRSEAFYYECRVRYFLSYVRTRAQLLLQTPA